MTRNKHLNEHKKWAKRVGGTLGAVALATLAHAAAAAGSTGSAGGSDPRSDPIALREITGIGIGDKVKKMTKKQFGDHAWKAYAAGASIVALNIIFNMMFPGESMDAANQRLDARTNQQMQDAGLYGNWQMRQPDIRHINPVVYDHDLFYDAR